MLQMFLLVAAHAVSVTAQRSADAAKTFQSEDPNTGLPVLCDRCAPGTYLRATCTAAQKSDCARCPPGSFTEVWNHIRTCLRCATCGTNEVVKESCAPERDCSCECREGYFFNRAYYTCVRHTECPAGHGVVSKGSPVEDTVCRPCPPGFYSANASAHHNCTAHTSCQAGGQRLVLKGGTWHNSVCTTCPELTTRNGADYLREILPSFLVHQNLPVKHLCRLVLKSPSRGGQRPLREVVLRLPRGDLHALLLGWTRQADAAQLRRLPERMRRVGAVSAGEKLGRKLSAIDSQTARMCSGEDGSVSR